MLTELSGKGGSLCRHAKEGKIRCPLMIRSSSEDVLTGNLFQSLQVINPRWWLPDLLNRGLVQQAFRRQHFRRFRIRLWESKPAYPRELLPWKEGRTQVDVTLSWENPPTTVYFEMKYGSDLSASTVHSSSRHGYPTDQLIRNLRVGLWETGYFDLPRLPLGRSPERDFLVFLVGLSKEHPLVRTYQSVERVKASIPKSRLLRCLPREPFVGEISYRDIVEILGSSKRFLNPTERAVANQLIDYLSWKMAHRPRQITSGEATSLLVEQGRPK